MLKVKEVHKCQEVLAVRSIRSTMTIMKYVFYLTLLLIAPLAYSSPAEEPEDDRIPILESAKELLGTQTNFAANRLDSFFATDRADDEFGRSRLRIRSNYELRERAVSELKNTYRINLKLPHLEDKFRFTYKKETGEKDKDKKKKEESQPEQLSEAEERQKIKDQGLYKGWLFNSDIGVSAAIPPKLITRARVRKNLITGSLIHRFVEQLTYITDESGLLEETRIDSDHVYSEDLVFRFVNYKRWQVLQKEFATSHGPTLLQRLTEDDALNYGFIMSSTIDDSWFVDNYRISINYRRNVYKQWVYFDIIPGIDFPKQWSFRRTPFIGLQLEILFGQS